MQRRKTALLVAWLVLGWGCSSKQVAMGLFVRVSGKATEPFEARLRADDGSCLRLERDAKATANGIALELSERGSSEDEWYTNHGFPKHKTVCNDPTFVLQDPTPLLRAPVVEVEITNGKQKLVGAFRDLWAPRKMSLDRPVDSVVHAGETLTVTWSPASDTIASRGTYSADAGVNHNPRFGFKPASGRPLYVFAEGTPSGPGTYTFKVPEAWAKVNAGEVRLEGYVHAGVERCEGTPQPPKCIGDVRDFGSTGWRVMVQP